MAEGGDKISGYGHLWLREEIQYRLWSPMAEGGDKVSGYDHLGLREEIQYRVMITYC